MTETNQITCLSAGFLKDPVVFDQWYRRMSGQRRQKISAFRRVQDQRLSLAAGILLESGLRQRHINPEHLLTGANGKPFTRDGGFFNLSHSEELAVCVFSEQDVGVDCEKIRHFEPNLAEYVFHPEECELACSGRFESEDAGYTYLWTVKESLMKYFGIGLSMGPKQILTDTVGAVVTGSRCSAKHLHFTPYRVGDYLITVCSPDDPFTCGPDLIPFSPDIW